MKHESRSKILVVGATGTVGGATLHALLERGAAVRALVRSQRGAARLGARADVEVVKGDLADGASIRRALDGVQAAFYVSPHEPNEETVAADFIAACEALAVRLVFVGVHIDGASRWQRALRRFLYGRMLPHYRPKFRIAERARTSRANPIVLVPTNFYQNDELFREDLLAGNFAQPFERPFNRVDVRDIGAAAARACLDRSLPAGAYPIVGPESLDATACAAHWTRALGRSVRYRGASCANFEAALSALDAKKRADFLATYTVIPKFELATRTGELAATTALLGRAPTAYADFVRETAARWQADAERKAS